MMGTRYEAGPPFFVCMAERRCESGAARMGAGKCGGWMLGEAEAAGGGRVLPRLYPSLTTTAPGPRLMGGNAATPKRPERTRGEYTNLGKSHGVVTPCKAGVMALDGGTMGGQKFCDGGDQG